MDELMDEVRERAIEMPENAQRASETLNAHVDTPARTWSVLASAYLSGGSHRTQVQFVFPAGIADALPTFSVELLDSENWKFRCGGTRGWRAVPWHKDMVRTSVSAGDIEPFSTLSVDAIEADGEVLVYIPLANRRLPEVYKNLRRKQEEMPTMLEPRDLIENVSEPPPPPEPVVPVTSLEGRLRGVLQQIREIEAQCPYRLSREGDRVVWQAPVIG